MSDYVAWAGQRNRDAILKLLTAKLDASAKNVLEFASGSGMHAAYFASHFPNTKFQPSDKTEETFTKVRQFRDEGGCRNVRDPIVLDLTAAQTWPNPQDRRYQCIFCINVFQVAPVAIADGMMQCAAQLLEPDGFLLIYGPFKLDGEYRTDSNKEFDCKLLSAGVAEWGLKDVSDLSRTASDNGLELTERIDMPANNFSLLFRPA